MKREDVLDVKLRSAQVRQTRLRVAAGILAFGASVFFVLLVIWRGGEWILDRFVLENDSFAIKRIEVETDGTLAPELVRKWAGVKVKDNLIALDLSRVKRDLELVPVIETAAVERLLPDTLRLRIVERVPLAQVFTVRPRPGATNGYQPVVYHLDTNGYIISPQAVRRTEPGASDFLPTVTGVNPAELQPGRRVESVQIHAALRLIEAFENSPMAGVVDLQHIDVSVPEMLRVRSGQGNDVTFGLNNIDQQLRRWRMVHDIGLKQHKSIATLDLSVSNNVPANFVELSVVPPVKAKPVKTSRAKKRNV
ncbi:MAG: FtsQ-type POTRA domain-containing protein [Verrucomicrobiota bacterium]